MGSFVQFCKGASCNLSSSAISQTFCPVTMSCHVIAVRRAPAIPNGASEIRLKHLTSVDFGRCLAPTAGKHKLEVYGGFIHEMELAQIALAS